MIPGLATIGVLLNPANPITPSIAKDVQAAVLSVGLKAVVMEASSEGELDTHFAQFVEQRVDGFILGSAAFFNRYMDRLVGLAARHRLPAIFSGREFAAAGGLMSYGADNRDAYRQAGIYVGRILKGDKPADLPIMQPTRFELIINLRTAKALGLLVPQGLLAIAGEVIE